jgi:NAD(P)-dependent dehydrogenase (short-subunit alcohol dehydrogenase family)
MLPSKLAFVPPTLLALRPRLTLDASKHVSRQRRFAASMTASVIGNPASTALITGASGGIGAETALRLPAVLPNLSHLILAARNTQAAEEVAKMVRSQAPRFVDVSVVPIELASLQATRACACAVRDILGDRPLDLLVNNAGIMACPLAYTEDGLELQYGVNHIGAAALTMELLPKLRSAEEGRVIFVSSMAVAMAKDRGAPALVGSKMRGTLTESKYSKWQSYGESKQAISLFAKALSQREPSLVVLSLHPGVVRTDLGRHIVPKAFQKAAAQSDFFRSATDRFFSLFGLLSPAEGAAMSLELAGVTKFSIESGAFYAAPGMRQAPRQVIPLLGDKSACDRLFESTVQFLDSHQ